MKCTGREGLTLVEHFKGYSKKNGKVKRAKNTLTIGKCSSCLSKNGNLFCCQLTSATTFISQQTKGKFKIYHKVICKRKYIIYFMECILCSKQYVGKAKTAFNIRLNNDKKYTKTQRQY